MQHNESILPLADVGFDLDTTGQRSQFGYGSDSVGGGGFLGGSGSWGQGTLDTSWITDTQVGEAAGGSWGTREVFSFP